MIPSLDKVQEDLLRFRYMDDSFHFLVDVCEKSTSPFSLTILHKYACIDLVNFLDHYGSFLKLLDEKEAKLVLTMAPFIEEIFKNKDELRRTRNKWTAHVNKGNMVNELSKPIIPVSAQDMVIMINGLNLFVKGLETIFPHQTNYILENFTKELEEITTESSITNETIEIVMNGKIGIVNSRFQINNLSFQFDEKKFDIKA